MYGDIYCTEYAADLFLLSIFSQYRSCDDTQESIFFQSWTFSYSHVAFFNEQNKSSYLLGVVT